MEKSEHLTKSWEMSFQTVKPYEIPDINRIVDSVHLSVVHGEGKMSGKSWIRLDWGNEGLYPMEAASFGFDGIKFTSLTGDDISDDTVIKQAQDILDKDPALLKELNVELKK